jgi:hypothetical protein
MNDESQQAGNMAGAADNSDHSTPAEPQRQDPRQVAGVSVFGFSAESRARHAGLQKGDVIVEYDGVGDLTSDKLATLAAAAHRESRIPTAFVRNGQEHSVMLPAGPLGISVVDFQTPEARETRRAGSKIERTVRRIRIVYLCVAVASVVAMLAGLHLSKGIVRVLDTGVIGILSLVAYLGLRYKKESVIPFVLLFSALECFGRFVVLMSPAEDVKTMLGKVVALCAFMFFAYQIRFFCRPDVRALFKDKSTSVF